jgi:hypothetical protein
MSGSIKDSITANLQKAKSEGRVRAERIWGIVRGAFSQTLVEVKEGSGEIRATVNETLSKVLETVNKTDEETAEQFTSTSSKSIILVVFKAIRNRLLPYLHHQYTELNERAVNLDANLTERNSNRYVAVKQRLERIAAWYNNVAAQATTMEPNILQQRHAEFENKLGEAGATLARKERHVKQQLRKFWQIATVKL